MKRLLFVGLFFLASCGSSSSNGYSGGVVTSASESSAYVGTWAIQTENGIDISAQGGLLIFTEATMTQSAGTGCSNSQTIEVSDTSWVGSVVSTDCVGEAVSDAHTGTIEISGRTMTIACADCSWGIRTAVKNATGSAPVIHTLSMDSSSATVNQDGGATKVNVSIGFYDTDGDISSVIVKYSDGTPITSILTSKSGTTSGAMRFDVILGTATEGTYELQIWAVDEETNTSNMLTATYAVTAS